jgi:hypothetical protein
MSEQSAALGDSGFLRAMLNMVIPPEAHMPGAGDMDLWPAVAGSVGQSTAAVASLTADLDAVRRAALARDPRGLAALAPAAAVEVVQSVMAERPEFMPALARAISMAYYQQPAVLIALGEPARPPFPEGFELEPIPADWLALLQRRAQRGAPPATGSRAADLELA